MRLIQFLKIFCLCFRKTMVITRNNPRGGGTSDEEIRRIIAEEVTATIREAIPEMFRSIKTTLIETFEERYAVVIEVGTVAAAVALAIARPQGGDLVLLREFSNTKQPKFNGNQDKIASVRWIFDIDGCFYTFSCPKDLKVRFTLNQLRLGAKN